MRILQAMALGMAACAAPTTTTTTTTSTITTVATTGFEDELVAAIRGGDASRIAARFAPDGVLWWVGREPWRGRASIETAIGDGLGRWRQARVQIGRTWVGPDASVIEVVVTGERASDGRPAGVVGAAVIHFDRAGLATHLRLYLDAVTAIGQLDPARLPADTRVRPVATAPPAGTAVTIAGSDPRATRNLAVTARIWAAVNAHRADDAVAAMTDDYVYLDFAAPAPLDRAGTRQVVADLVAAIPDFAVATPVRFAAGDDVISELDERGTFRGQPVALHGLDVRRFRDGRVSAEWQYSNAVEVLRLLGCGDGLEAP